MELEDFEESDIIFFLEIKLNIRKATGIIVKVRKLFFVNKIGITVKKLNMERVLGLLLVLVVGKFLIH